VLTVQVGVLKEVKNSEYRVALTPAGAASLVSGGHRVLVECGAGVGSGFPDEDYRAAGAVTLDDKSAIARDADMILKVKEPLPEEYGLFHEGQVLFTYLHLASEPELTRALVASRVVAIAYETVQPRDGSLPLLRPMSEIAGRMSIQAGAHFLEKPAGGRGVLLGGVPGVPPGKVTIVGGGTVGTNAAKVGVGLGARVTVMDVSQRRLAYLDDVFGGRLTTVACNPYNIAAEVVDSDLVVGAVLVPGAKAPKLITKEMVKTMRPGSVIVDVAIDQGGSVETVDRATTHADPVYVKHGVVHYSVANMPGAVPRTSTFALTNATLPYVLELANKGWKEAVSLNPALAKGVNVVLGKVTCEGVAEAHGLAYHALEELL